MSVDYPTSIEKDTQSQFLEFYPNSCITEILIKIIQKWILCWKLIRKVYSETCFSFIGRNKDYFIAHAIDPLLFIINRSARYVRSWEINSNWHTFSFNVCKHFMRWISSQLTKTFWNQIIYFFKFARISFFSLTNDLNVN